MVQSLLPFEFPRVFQVLAKPGSGRNIRSMTAKPLTGTLSVKLPDAHVHSAALVSPHSAVHQEARMGLPPRVHRVTEPPHGAPAAFGGMGDGYVGPTTPQHNLLTAAPPRSGGVFPEQLGSAGGVLSKDAAGHGLAGRNILGVKDFNREQIHHLFNVAHKMRTAVQRDRPLDHVLKVGERGLCEGCVITRGVDLLGSRACVGPLWNLLHVMHFEVSALPPTKYCSSSADNN